jgi:hypothetical protein
MKIYIGIDNGVTGTIGIVGDGIEPQLYHTPVIKEQDYTKKKKEISRVNCEKFLEIIKQFDPKDVRAVIERPMINPTRFTASISAVRCLEAELILLESLGISHMFIDSKEWQKKLLPQGIKGDDEQKKASYDIGNRLFPQFTDFKHKDRDGLLIAEWARRTNI